MLTLSDILRRVRNRLDDTIQPYLWSDQELLDYVNDTLYDAAVRAELVVESELEVLFTHSTATEFNATYTLPRGIIYVRQVRLASIPELTLEEISTRRQQAWSRARYVTTGTVYGYALDLTNQGTGLDSYNRVRTITFFGTPTKADTAILGVVRLPAKLALTELNAYPELDPIWHQHLIEGITGLAYLKRDADTFDPKKSAEDLATFELKFGPRLPAVVIRERQTDVPREMILE